MKAGRDCWGAVLGEKKADLTMCRIPKVRLLHRLAARQLSAIAKASPRLVPSLNCFFFQRKTNNLSPLILQKHQLVIPEAVGRVSGA